VNSLFEELLNLATLGAIFGRKMMTPANIERRRRTVIDFVLSYLQLPDAEPLPSIRRRAGELASLVS
jgi:hypothetical protein